MQKCFTPDTCKCDGNGVFEKLASFSGKDPAFSGSISSYFSATNASKHKQRRGRDPSRYAEEEFRIFNGIGMQWK